MRKVIREILVLLWKVLRLLLWRWLKPILGRVILLSLVAIGVIVVLIVLVGGGG